MRLALATFALGVMACTKSPSGAASPDSAGDVDASVVDSASPVDADPADSRSTLDVGVVTTTLPAAGGAGKLVMPGRVESAIEVALPSPMPTNPPLVIAFHGTGGEPADGLDFASSATAKGAVVIAPRAGYRDGKHPADVDHDVDEGGSSWNLWAQGPAANEDLRYVLSLIASAKATYKVDTTRVYAFGFSNGAFMSYFAAVSLPDAIAGFAEASGGWTTDACPSRYGAISDGFAYAATSGPAPGSSVACASLYAAKGFPGKCVPTATNKLRPPAFGARVPFGYLAHYSDDDVVSVMWSCFLGDALGARAQVTIRFADAGGIRGHSSPPDFVDRAWAFFANRTNTQ